MNGSRTGRAAARRKATSPPSNNRNNPCMPTQTQQAPRRYTRSLGRVHPRGMDLLSQKQSMNEHRREISSVASCQLSLSPDGDGCDAAIEKWTMADCAYGLNAGNPPRQFSKHRRRSRPKRPPSEAPGKSSRIGESPETVPYPYANGLAATSAATAVPAAAAQQLPTRFERAYSHD